MSQLAVLCAYGVRQAIVPRGISGAGASFDEHCLVCHGLEVALERAAVYPRTYGLVFLNREPAMF